MSFLRGLAGIVVVFAMAGIGALFALQNEALVPLDMLVYQFAPRSLALWVLAAFALGGVAGVLMAGFAVLRLRARMRLLNRQLIKAQGEADRLRNSGIVARD
ncbi:MAG: lipopolysaccharide assembly protein LapA domain-containing protein [Chromatocurvus sp.]